MVSARSHVGVLWSGVQDRWLSLTMEDQNVNDDDFAELFKKLSSGQSTSPSWQDVADELEALGRTFTEMVRRAWQSAESSSELGQLREMVALTIDELQHSIDDTPEAAQARAQLLEIRDALQSAASRAGTELRPELLNMLRQANAELRRRSGLDTSPD
jgi:hypothetical protein